MKVNRVAALLFVAAVCMTGPAVAAESDATPAPTATGALSLTALVPSGTAMKRPALLPPLYVTLAAVQAWDIFSTLASIKAGGSERNPIAARFTGNSAAFIGFKVLSTAGTMYFTERTWKSNRLTAVIVLAAINGATAAVSMHNLRVASVAPGR